MTIEELLQQILGGGQAPVNRMASNWNGPDAEPNRLVAPQAMPPQAMPMQQAGPPAAMQPQGAPMATQQQQAPVAAPQPSGGGILDRLFGGGQGGAENQTIQWLQQQGMDPGTATIMARHKPSLQAYLLKRSEGSKPIEINGKLVDPNTYEVIADYSDQGEGMSRVLTQQEADAMGLPPGSSYQVDAHHKITSVGGAREQDPTFSRELDLSKAYNSEKAIEQYNIVRPQYERIREGVAANQTAPGAGDIAIVFSYMKMLDPTSTVARGEQAGAENAGGVPAWITAQYNKLVGGGQIANDTRQQFLRLATSFYKQAAGNVQDVNKRYSKRATDYKLDPSHIVFAPEDDANLLVGDMPVEEGPSLDDWREVSPGVKIRPKAN